MSERAINIPGNPIRIQSVSPKAPDIAKVISIIKSS